MKIVCISDTHGAHRRLEVPEGDMLIHAGDCMNSGVRLNELTDFNAWFSSQPHKYKVLIAGNHDWLFQQEPNIARSSLDPAIIYLQDSGADIEGMKLYGSPWQPEFNNWAFNLPRGGAALREKWASIPDGTDILITHGPPYGFCDRVRPLAGSLHLGCAALDERVRKLRPRIHIFGHIHGGYGQKQMRSTLYVNAATMDERYALVNKPTVLEV